MTPKPSHHLKHQAEDKPGAESAARDDLPSVRVIADFRWLHEEPLQRLPTISRGGPGTGL